MTALLELLATDRIIRYRHPRKGWREGILRSTKITPVEVVVKRIDGSVVHLVNKPKPKKLHMLRGMFK